MYIVSDRPNLFPDIRMMTSSGAKIESGPDTEGKLEPTDKDMRIISVKEAKELFGRQAGSVSGVSVSDFQTVLITRY